VPCLVNPGIGDVVEIVEADGTGIVLADLSSEAIDDAAARLVALASEEGIAARCVAAAHRRFSLLDGVARYRALYQRLAAQHG
jgi:glycosyltransferase involved in cell wall biosynthesis